MSVMKANGVRLLLTGQGRPAAFEPDTDRCIINILAPHYEVSAYFVHEMYHASQYHTGHSHGAKTMDHDAWVNMMVTEEIEGTFKGFLHKQALEQAGRAPKDDKPPGMTQFRGAYDYGLKQAQQQGLSGNAAEQAAQANGRRMAVWLINPGGGQWPTLAPNQFESYAMYYNREWHQQNPGP
jgi:hypothetical protein